MLTNLLSTSKYLSFVPIIHTRHGQNTVQKDNLYKYKSGIECQTNNNLTKNHNQAYLTSNKHLQ